MKRDVTEIRKLAEECVSQGKYEEGIAIYKELIEQHQGDDSLAMSLAWAYQDNGETDMAIECLEGLLEKELAGSIFIGFAFDELVRIYRNEGQYEKLLSICERSVALYPNEVSLLTTLGDACLRFGNTDRAIRVFEMLTEMEPDSPVHLCSLGNAHIANGNIKKGKKAYEKASRIDPSEAPVFFSRLGHFLSRCGHLAEAEEAVRKSIKINGSDPATYCSLGDILITQNKVDEGMASYEKAIQIDAASKDSYYNRLGNVLSENSHHLEAVGAYEKAVAAEPANPFYRARLVESHKQYKCREEINT
ncbi:MAG: tetratricopeptide repeat protein [Deltaproteobacteria bacterium]|nr:tetratricopeptide repeat protein [Deltaproteobacteria bacterium]